MSTELDPVVFQVLANTQGALDAMKELQGSIEGAAAVMAQVSADFRASADQISVSMEGMATRTQESTAKAVEAQHGMGESFKKLLELAGVFAAYDFMKEAVQVAAEGQDSLNRLKQSVKDAGQSWTEDLGRSVEDVDSQMRAWGYTNAETNNSLTRLVQLTHNTATAENLMGLAANVAAGRHTDLASAVRIVTMAASGHVAMLARLGIQTKDAEGKTLSARAAVEKLGQTFGGQAAAQAGTFAGKLAAFKAQVDDAKEKVGNALIPILSQLIPIFVQLIQTLAARLAPILNTISALWSKHHSVIMVVIGVLVTLIGLIKLYQGSVKLVSGLIEAWTAVTKALGIATVAETGEQTALNVALDANPIGLVITLIGALVAAFIWLWNTCKPVRDFLTGMWNDIQQAAGNAVAWIINNVIQPYISNFVSLVNTIISGLNALSAIIPGLKGVSSALQGVVNFANNASAGLGMAATSAKTWGHSTSSAATNVGHAIKAAAGGGGRGYMAPNLNSGYGSGISNAPTGGGGGGGGGHAAAKHHAARLSAAKKAAEAHKKLLEEHHKALLAAERKHHAEVLAEQKRAAEERRKALQLELAQMQLEIYKAKNAMKASGDLLFVNGQLANVGSSMLNLNHASGITTNVITVNVQGSVTTAQQLTDAVHQGILVKQRTNASAGIHGKHHNNRKR